MNKLKAIVKVLDEKLANDITVIDMSIDSPICDYFVIASASNERLLLALKDHIEEACDKEGYFVKNIEGRKNSKWIMEILLFIYLILKKEKITGLKNCGLINPLFRLRIFYNVL